VSELADERDLGSRGAIRVGSSPTFPMRVAERAGVVQLAERLLAKEKVVGSNPIARFSVCQVPGGDSRFAQMKKGASSGRQDGPWEVGEFHWKLPRRSWRTDKPC
jgi:hypothetical protein